MANEKNIYDEDSKTMSEAYTKMKQIYHSITFGISAEEELEILHEMVRLDFHRIPKDGLRGDKHKFLEGFRKGLEYGLRIVQNRNKPIEEQNEKSVSDTYYF